MCSARVQRHLRVCVCLCTGMYICVGVCRCVRKCVCCGRSRNKQQLL